MGLLDLPKVLLGKTVSKGSVLAAVGGFAANVVLGRTRRKWQQAEGDNLEAVLDYITAYDISRGGGKLIAGWLRFKNPKLTLDSAEARLQKLLLEMDKKDESPVEQARNRMLASKALFYMEGFKLSQCRYEVFQKEAQQLLRQHPTWKTVSRQDIFKATPFEPEELIGTTQRMLFLLGNDKLADYIVNFVQNGNLRDDADYMTRLIAMTMGVEEDEQFCALIYQWFAAYRDFKINETHQQETTINNSLGVVTGGLPAMASMDLLTRAIQKVMTPASSNGHHSNGKPKKPTNRS